jgi:hypothetical protein
MLALEPVVRVSDIEIRYWDVLRNSKKSTPLKVPVRVAVDWNRFRAFLAKRGIKVPNDAQQSWEEQIRPKVEILLEYRG